MNKHTLNAIQRRISAGKKEFTIGELFYWVQPNGIVLSNYTTPPGCLSVEGIVVNNKFYPGIFDPEKCRTEE
nr:MAG TPA: hypothetical protein [Bacteriophage sp.]DAT51039.1 MAG TPA: hypothetical protein [Caudoviricetes sp.]